MRLGQWIGFFALVVSLYILWQIRQVVLLVFAAVVLATVLNRVVRLLQQYRIKRGIAIAITVVLLLLLVVGIFAVIVPRLVAQLQQFVYLLPQALERVRGWYERLQTLIPGGVLQDDRGLNALTQQLQTFATRLVGNFFALISNSLAVVLSLLLFFVITIMLLVNPSPYRRTFVLAFPAFYRRRVDEIISQCEESLVGWIKGTLLAMFVIGILSYIGLLILRVPLPLVNALIAGLLEFIPNVGPALSILPPVLLALLDAPWKAGAVIGLYLLIQQFESLVLVPVIMAQEVSLLPVFTILAVVVFASFFGFLGLFLAIPLLIVTQIWLKEVLVKDVLNRWQGDIKGIPPEAPDPRDSKPHS
ncbi:MAG: AI-2E family transporter [Gloeocapsa sp. UFS-A4-WI-NPMV-4B04]|nr:AI-2E family transporter [Gloeocapsa sp. UFS-A4-WI-NPMV-4B04]